MMTAKPIRIVLAGVASSILLLAAGCASPATLQTWQQRVEEYVRDEANGDPNALRDMTWADSQKGFAVLGSSVPDVSTDTNGLLLAHREIAGRYWFIFLVGQVEKQAVQDIRLAAFSADAGHFQWVLSDANTQALDAYRQFRVGDWKRLYPDRADPPTWYLRFPAEDDAFDLAIDDARISAKHRQSGAQWMLQLPRKQIAQLDAAAATPAFLNE